MLRSPEIPMIGQEREMPLKQSASHKKRNYFGWTILSRLLVIGIYTITVAQIILVEKEEKQSLCINEKEQEVEQHVLHDPKPMIRSFVCINGQLERLELDNKIKNMLNPIMEDIGGTIDIALIMTENKAIYTKQQISTERAKHVPQFTEYKQAAQYLAKKGFNVVTSQPIEHVKDPTVHHEYRLRLAQMGNDKKLKDPSFFAYDKGRAQNHVRQAITGELCYRHMVGTGHDYSHGIVARWRDDVGFQNRLPIARFNEYLHNPPPVKKEVDLGKVQKGQQRPIMVTPYCRNWNGLNDRGGFVHSDGAYAYFMAPIVAFTRAQLLPSNQVCSHERFLRHIYNNEGFLFVPSRDLYPIPMFRNNNTAVYRKEEKDNMQCRNWWYSYRPDCPRQNETIELLAGH